MGARRWLRFGDMSLQPSELMKVAIIGVIARYYQWLPPDRVSRPQWVGLPLLLIAPGMMIYNLRQFRQTEAF